MLVKIVLQKKKNTQKNIQKFCIIKNQPFLSHKKYNVTCFIVAPKKCNFRAFSKKYFSFANFGIMSFKIFRTFVQPGCPKKLRNCAYFPSSRKPCTYM